MLSLWRCVECFIGYFADFLTWAFRCRKVSLCRAGGPPVHATHWLIRLSEMSDVFVVVLPRWKCSRSSELHKLFHVHFTWVLTWKFRMQNKAKLSKHGVTDYDYELPWTSIVNIYQHLWYLWTYLNKCNPVQSSAILTYVIIWALRWFMPASSWSAPATWAGGASGRPAWSRTSRIPAFLCGYHLYYIEYYTYIHTYIHIYIHNIIYIDII